jgi:hypothetical protein
MFSIGFNFTLPMLRYMLLVLLHTRDDFFAPQCLDKQMFSILPINFSVFIQYNIPIQGEEHRKRLIYKLNSHS